jgi:hypothetical protein
MAVLGLRRQAVHRPKQPDAGPLAADVASFRLHLAAETRRPGSSGPTPRRRNNLARHQPTAATPHET